MKAAAAGDFDGLWEVFGKVPDHRRAEGKRYPLAGLLVFAVTAMLAGRRDQLAIVRLGRKLDARGVAGGRDHV